MGAQPKPIIELTLDTEEIPENTSKSENLPPIPQEVPTITTLLQRKKLEPTTTSLPRKQHTSTIQISLKEQANFSESGQIELSTPSIEQPAESNLQSSDQNDCEPQIIQSTRNNIRKKHTQLTMSSTTPPPFTKQIVLCQFTSFEDFQMQLNVQTSEQMKKLYWLSYFGKYFDEILYFDVATTHYASLGFGNTTLVSQVKSIEFSAEKLPSLFSLIVSETPFIDTNQALKSEEWEFLFSKGFTQSQSFGIFPTLKAEKLSGFWFCTSHNAQLSLAENEIQALSSLLAVF